MASTSTNKQPLLVDNVLHKVVDTANAMNTDINITGANTAALLVNGSGSDGAIIEDIYAISRDGIEYTINLYLSSSFDYLRPNDAMFIGQFKSTTTKGAIAHHTDMPYVLAPVPATGITTGDAPRFKALYIPRNMSLWVARQGISTNDAPLVGVQGGWY